MYTDTHCHLFKEYYENIETVIREANDVGVHRMIVASTNMEDSKEVVELSEKYPNIYFCLGIHPDSCTEERSSFKDYVLSLKNHPKFVGIGEIGLDYYYGKETREEQLILFEEMLALAENVSKPVVIHSREATKDTIDILKKYPVKGIMHCYSGSLETAKILIDMGFFIGVGGVMTFKNAHLREIIKEIPIENIVLETDSPYLTPEPYRKYQNMPKYTPVIAEYLANLKHKPITNVAEQTEKNVAFIFDI